MGIGLVGKKQGMTRFFTEDGKGFGVTVVSAEPNTVTQIQTVENEGYSSVQVTTGKRKEKHINKPLIGHYRRSSVAPGEGLWEFRASKDELSKLEVGSSISLEQFAEDQLVDISGISKGKVLLGQ